MKGLGTYLLLAGAVGCAASAEVGPIKFQGTATGQLENYSSNGDPARATYADEGAQWFGELDLTLSQEFSDYNKWDLRIFGLYNQSDYRSSFEDFSIENFRFSHQNGDAAVPYRLQVGDYFASISDLTLSRTLKGAQLEFQPDFEFLSPFHSLVFFTGAQQSSYRDFQYRDNAFTGVSYLIEATPLGSFSLNWVNNDRQGSIGSNRPDRSQDTLSFAWSQAFDLGNQKLDISAEYAYYTGDDEAGTLAASGSSESDSGYFLEILGSNQTPFSYRLRYENFGDEFVPQGKVVSTARRSYEFHPVWQFANGLALRGRYQHFDNGFQTANPSDSDLYGVNLAGPFGGGINGSVDFYIQQNENPANTLDNETAVFTSNVSMPLNKVWTGQFSFLTQRNDDHIGGPDRSSHSFGFNASRQWSFGRFTGTISPGFSYRITRVAGGDVDEISPSLGLSLGHGAHSLQMRAGLNRQDRLENGLADLDSYNLSAGYRYNSGNWSTSIDYDLRASDPEDGRVSDNHRLSLSISYAFGGEISREKGIYFEPQRSAGFAPRRGGANAVVVPLLLTQIEPGGLLPDGISLLEGQQIREPAPFPGALVYEHQVFREISERQRIVLVYQDNQISNSGVIVNFGLGASARDVERALINIIESYNDLLGQPITLFEEGEFSENLIADLNSQRFSRIYEWITGTGTLRVGIPRRLDGTVRVEVQHARSFPSVRDSLWSIEQIQ